MGLQQFIFTVLGMTFLGLRAWSLDVSATQARDIKTFSSPHYRSEICLLPNHSNEATYSERDSATEQQLCQYDFYGLTPSTQHVATCPKTGSTNPGLLFFLSKADLSFPDHAVSCEKRDSSLTMVAKHKQSLSCSYTPSILMYYHLSRRFGHILNTPVAVVRTIDKDEHLNWTRKALTLFSEANKKQLIYQNWEHYLKAHEMPEDYPKVFTTDGRFVYGALLTNPPDEQYYGDVSGKGAYETRVERFMKLPPFLKVSDERSIDKLNAGLSFTERVQNYVQMTDVSNMVLMDQLLNQADRVGNISYHYRTYAVDNGLLRKVPAETPGAAVVKEMILQDNDCGIIKQNMFKKFGVLEKVRHLSPATYHHFMTWSRSLQKPETLEFLTKEILLTQDDIFKPKSGLLANATSLRQTLLKNCRSGFLKLDLGFDRFDQPYRFNAADCGE